MCTHTGRAGAKQGKHCHLKTIEPSQRYLSACHSVHLNVSAIVRVLEGTVIQHLGCFWNSPGPVVKRRVG
jgi:hypothetical protein